MCTATTVKIQNGHPSHCFTVFIFIFYFIVVLCIPVHFVNSNSCFVLFFLLFPLSVTVTRRSPQTNRLDSFRLDQWLSYISSWFYSVKVWCLHVQICAIIFGWVSFHFPLSPLSSHPPLSLSPRFPLLCSGPTPPLHIKGKWDSCLNVRITIVERSLLPKGYLDICGSWPITCIEHFFLKFNFFFFCKVHKRLII